MHSQPFYRRGNTKLYLTLSLLGLFLFAILTAPAQSALAAGNYSGNAFRDYNANGVKDTREPGIGGIVVTFYDNGGTSRGSTTTAPVCLGNNLPIGSICTALNTPAVGNWSLTPSGSGPYRVEFTGAPAYVQQGVVSSASGGNGTSVQFVADGGLTNINYAVNNPGDYCQSNPTLVTCTYVQGDQNSGPNSAEATVVSFPYNSTGTTAPTDESLASQVGSNWGVVYRRSTQKVYVSAFMKRNAGFGKGVDNTADTADDAGAIYEITVGGTQSAVATIPNAGGSNAFGSGLHSSFTCGGGGSCDATGFANVGKKSLGGLALSEDETKMWSVNLNNGHLYEVAFPGFGVTDRGAIPSPCNAGNSVARPFAAHFQDGTLYVGGVCDASVSQSKANLLAYVYTFNPSTNAFSASPVISFALNYSRTCNNFGGYSSPIPTCRTGTLGPLAAWNAWTDNINTAMVNGTTFQAGVGGGGYPMPQLSDIDFDNTDMILGFRDRFADMYGFEDPGPNSTNPIGSSQTVVPAGDILRANPNGSGGWTIESNSGSNPAGIFGPTSGAGGGQGPSNGEFYCEERMIRHHDESSFGAVLQVPGFTEVIDTAADPLDTANTGGLMKLSNTVGTCLPTNTTTRGAQYVSGYQVYSANTSNFQKANGLGDMIALCNSAPIEIGNRVWSDTTKNGRQDPNESGVSGVVVGLYSSAGALIAQVTTDSNGNYLFSSASGTDVTGKNYNVTISPNTQYTVAVFNSNFNGGQPLNSIPNRTIFNFDGQTTNNAFTDIRDSDAVLLAGGGVGTGGNAATYGVTLTTSVLAGAGYNNHSIDFGFSNTPTAVEMGTLNAQVQSGNAVEVNWQSLNETLLIGFNVQRSDTKKGEYANLNRELLQALSPGSITGNAYAFTDTDVAANTKYHYRIEAIHADGTTSTTGSVAVTTGAVGCAGAQAAPAPVSPQNHAQVKKGKVVFTWDASTCAASYKFQLRADSPQGEVVLNKKDLTTTQVSFKKMELGKTYHWRVLACGADGKCTASAWWSVQVKRIK